MSCVTLNLLMQSQKIPWQKPCICVDKAFRKKVYVKFSRTFCLELITVAFRAITIKKAAFKSEPFAHEKRELN